MPTKEEARQSVIRLVTTEAMRGNIVISTHEGLKIIALDEFVQQSAQGILYDLNRLPEVALAFSDDPKWVNDYAVGLVIARLKDMLNEKNGS